MLLLQFLVACIKETLQEGDASLWDLFLYFRYVCTFDKTNKPRFDGTTTAVLILMHSYHN